jgi:hypothetical protein
LDVGRFGKAFTDYLSVRVAAVGNARDVFEWRAHVSMNGPARNYGGTPRAPESAPRGCVSKGDKLASTNG